MKFLFLLLAFLCFAEDSPDPAQDATKDLQNFQQQAQQLMKQLDGVNPGAGGEAQVEVMKRKALKLATDQRFLHSAGELWNHPNRKKLLAIQAGFFLLMLILKAWQQSRSPHWFRRMLVGLAFTVLTWVGVAYIVPLLVLGEPYVVFTSTLWRVVVSG